MSTDLNRMSREELQTLRTDVEKALSTLEDRRRAEARAAVEKAARDHGYSLDDVVSHTPKKGKKSPPKYRNPEDPRQTWTGRGRQPSWIKEGLDNGHSLEEYAI